MRYKISVCLVLFAEVFLVVALAHADTTREDESILFFLSAFSGGSCQTGKVSPINNSTISLRDVKINDDNNIDLAVDGRGCFNYLQTSENIQYVYAYIPETASHNATMVYQAIAFPGDTKINLSEKSTAVALIVSSLSLVNLMKTEDIKKFIESVVKLKEVMDFSIKIKQLMHDDLYLYESKDVSRIPSEYVESFAVALNAAKNIADTNFNSQKKINDLLLKAKNKDKNAISSLVKLVGGATSNFYTAEGDQATGNISVSNASFLYLSAQIKNLYDNTIIQDHISSLFDGNIIEPYEIDFGRLISGEVKNIKNFDKPTYTNSHIQIGTPGFSSSTGNALDSDVKLRLFAATLMKFGVLDVLSKAIGISVKGINRNCILKIANGNLQLFYNLMQAVSAQDFRTINYELCRFVLSNITNQGSDLYTCLSGLVGTKTMAMLGMRAFPFIGPVIKALDVASTGIQFAILSTAIIEMAATPESTEWEALWLQSSAISPTTISDVSVDAEVAINGKGFDPYVDFSAALKNLSIKLVKTDGTSSGYTIQDGDVTIIDNYHLKFKIASSFLANVFGMYNVVLKINDLEIVAGTVTINEPFKSEDFSDIEVRYGTDWCNSCVSYSLCLPEKAAGDFFHIISISNSYNGNAPFVDKIRLNTHIELTSKDGEKLKDYYVPYGTDSKNVHWGLYIDGDDVNAYPSGDMTLKVTVVDRHYNKGEYVYTPIKWSESTITRKHSMSFIGYEFSSVEPYNDYSKYYNYKIILTNPGYAPWMTVLKYNATYQCTDVYTGKVTTHNDPLTAYVMRSAELYTCDDETITSFCGATIDNNCSMIELNSFEVPLNY